MGTGLDAALPVRRRQRNLWHWQADKRREWQMAWATAQVLTPPPASAYGAFGESRVTAPARIGQKHCVHIGDGVFIDEGVWLSVVRPFDDITPRVVIEDNVRIGRFCAFGIAGDFTIARGAVIGDFTMVVDTIHPPEAEDRLHAVARPQPVHIGEGAVIATHVVILPGVTIGAGAYVEHHSVVGKDVAPGDYVAGYPARRRSLAKTPA